LVTAVTIDTDHAGLPVDVRLQLMELDAVGGNGIIDRQVGSPIFAVKIVFVTAVIIKTDMVAVMTGQASFIGGVPAEKMPAPFDLTRR
jgi:hypothetical protein